MNYDNIGFDAHLSREWDRYTDAQDRYDMAERIDELKKSITTLDEIRDELMAFNLPFPALDEMIDEMERELDQLSIE